MRRIGACAVLLAMFAAAPAVTQPAQKIIVDTDWCVDVDANHGPNHGVSVGAPEPWPGGEGARKMRVQTDLEWDRFIRLYVERVTRSLPAPNR
jgi:hypothetical protein